MKLVASLIVRNELDRYLKPCIAHLLEFCDEIAVVNDGSTDGTTGYFYGLSDPRIHACETASRFFEHEAVARQWLINWTIAQQPTHVLAIDADEFVSDGHKLRREIEMRPLQTVFKLCMEEVWHADHDALSVRFDGGWKPSRSPLLYRIDNPDPALWRIRDRKLACGREPERVRAAANTARALDVSVLHMGWANEQERAARHDRYVRHDNGQFHNRQHLASIMWDDRRVVTRRCAWPAALAPYRKAVVERANRESVSA